MPPLRASRGSLLGLPLVASQRLPARALPNKGAHAVPGHLTPAGWGCGSMGRTGRADASPPGLRGGGALPSLPSRNLLEAPGMAAPERASSRHAGTPPPATQARGTLDWTGPADSSPSGLWHPTGGLALK